MKRKAHFAEIIFKDEYYIDGVNIFDDAFRTFKRYLDVNLGLELKLNLSYSHISNAYLYKVRGRNRTFNVFIKQVKDFYIIGFISQLDLIRAYNSGKKTRCNDFEKNENILFEIALKNDVKLENCIYSNSGKIRAKISFLNDNIKVDYENLCIYDEYGFYFREDISSANFFSWEPIGETSFYENTNIAKKDIEEKLNLLENSKQIDPYYYFDGYEKLEVLWNYSHSSGYSLLYQLKYVALGICLFLVPFLLMCIFKVMLWTGMILFGGIGLISLVIAFFALKTNGLVINYEINEKYVYCFDGIEHLVTFANIEKVKIKKNIFSKKKASIIIKVKNKFFKVKIKYIEDYEKVYDIISTKMN